MDIRQAPMQAMNNRDQLSGTCGCFSCLAQFDAKEVNEWTDGGRTALCPKCQKDCVLSDIPLAILESIKKYWF